MSSATDKPETVSADENEVKVEVKETSPPSSDDSSTKETKEEKPQLNLMDVPVTDEHSALNVIVGFLGIAQRRGAFAINESAKIFECVKMFQKNQSA
jgi:hypothetical protein